MNRRLGQLSPGRVGLYAAVAGYLIGAGYLVFAILLSSSSTAAIGLLFVPLYAIVPGVLPGLVGAPGRG